MLEGRGLGRGTPITPPLPLLEVLGINVIEALIQSREASTLQGDVAAAEPTPEVRLVSEVETARLERLFDLTLGDPMLLVEMLGEGFLAIEYPTAGHAIVGVV